MVRTRQSATMQRSAILGSRQGCWTVTSTGKREAPFVVGDDVSALWPGDKKIAAGYYDAKVVRIDLVGLWATVAWRLAQCSFQITCKRRGSYTSDSLRTFAR